MEPQEGWEITKTGARTFTAIGDSCADVLRKLRRSLKDAGIRNEDTLSLNLYIGWMGDQFEGEVTVAT